MRTRTPHELMYYNYYLGFPGPLWRAVDRCVGYQSSCSDRVIFTQEIFQLSINHAHHLTWRHTVSGKLKLPGLKAGEAPSLQPPVGVNP